MESDDGEKLGAAYFYGCNRGKRCIEADFDTEEGRALVRRLAANADVVMMLRVQMERMNAAFFPSAREYSRRYGLDVPRMSSLPDHAIVMHPGPMNRGMEIAADVADADRSVILDQVTNGVHIRMAVLYLLMGGQEA